MNISKLTKAAFARLITAIGTTRHVRVLIPPGRFRLASRVVFTADKNDEYYGLRIEGAGMALSFATVNYGVQNDRQFTARNRSGLA